MSTPHKATPEQWEDAGAFASDTRAFLLELRDRITALEQFRESTAAHSLAMGEAMNQATASIAVLEASIAVLEQRVGAPVRMADRVAELRAALQRLALKGGKVTLPEICDVFEQWGRRLAAPASAPATEPAPAPTRSLVDAVEARAGGDARSAIREVADWLQRRHTGRIANGSQFAELLRQEVWR